LVDKTARLELLAEVYLKSNQQDKATDCYRQLLKRNPSNMQFYRQIFAASGVDLSNIDEAAEDIITKILDEKIEEHPRLLFLKRFKLNYLVREETFRSLFEEYCMFTLEKGIPSLVNDIEQMISENKMKFKVVKETFEKYLESIQRDLTIDGEERDPLYECFLLFFLSQINFIDGDYFKSHNLIEEAINHTPTFIEAWQFKARIMDAFADKAGAEEAFMTAKNLDTADRFLNAECAKYCIRNNKQEEANEIMKRWSVDMASDELNSFDLQNVWYEVESGFGHYNKDRYLDAFKMFYYIERHIITMLQDFYDFHFYTMRKFMLRTYMNIGNMQDSLRRNPYIQEGMIGMLRILNKLYSRLTHGSEEEKEKFMKWINEEAETHKEEEESKITHWEEVEERSDPIEKIADPSSAKALKRIIDAGIVKEAMQR
jgi:N-alpha-acetyltransferase 15/16, NatA auxiliary subunit